MAPSKSQLFAAFVAQVRRTAHPSLVIGAQCEDELMFLGHDANDVAALLGREMNARPSGGEVLICPISDLPAIEVGLAEAGTPFIFARLERDHRFRVFRTVLSDVNESFDDRFSQRIPGLIHATGQPESITGCEVMFAWEGRRECYPCEPCRAASLLDSTLAAGGRRFLGTTIRRAGSQPIVLSADATRALGSGDTMPSQGVAPFLPPRQTPWGYAHSFRRVGEGIAWVDTPDHGGIFLPAGFAQEVAAALTPFSPHPRTAIQWFEEDVSWAIAVIVLARHFTDEDLFRANEVQASVMGDDAARAYLASPRGADFRRRLAGFTERVRTCWRVTGCQPASSRRDGWKLNFRHMSTGEECSVLTTKLPRDSFVTETDFQALGASPSPANMIMGPQPAAPAVYALA